MAEPLPEFHATDLSARAEAMFASALRVAQTPGLAALRDRLRYHRARLHEPLNVALVGMRCAGKSTLINALLGEEELARTGDLEVTYNVNVISYGTTPGMQVRFRDDRPPREIAFADRFAWGTHQGDEPERDEVRFLQITHPAALLHRFNLIDTPGLASAHGRDSRNTEEFLTRTPPDALLCLFERGANETDRDIVKRFQGFASSLASPLNTIGVLSKVDEYWPAVPDPLQGSHRITRRLATDPALARLLYRVQPVCAWLALGAQLLDDRLLSILARLAAAPPAALQRALRSKARFAEDNLPDLAVLPTERREVLRRLDRYGVWLACRLLREGAARDRAALSAALLEYTGFPELKALVLSHFGKRAQLIKLDTALYELGQMCFEQAQALPQAEAKCVYQIAAHLQQFRQGEHTFREFDVLRDLYNETLVFPDSDRARLEFLAVTGEHGTSCASRLGLPEDASIGELRQVAEAGALQWRRRMNDPSVSNNRIRQAAGIAAISFERLAADLQRDAGSPGDNE